MNMLKANYIQHKFIFNSPGGTSRGILTEKPSYFIKIWDNENPKKFGLGETSLIPGLSPENTNDIEKLLNEFIINPEPFFKSKNLSHFPAAKFGIETAMLDFNNGGKQILFPSEFTKGNMGIKVNGLIWMGSIEVMLKRLKEKVEQGYTCIKIKVGAINFNDEVQLLKQIRKTFSLKQIEIRVDANGAFNPGNVLQKLETLSKYNIHSVEQPIKQGQWNNMAKLCKNTPLPIALDEELIGITDKNTRANLLDTIKPQFIVLKPSLVGGLNETKQWGSLAKKRNIGWWVTSALEGNIGLNAIAQWAFANGTNMPQGLGTGQVFANNIASPLKIIGEQLWYNPNLKWQSIF